MRILYDLRLAQPISKYIYHGGGKFSENLLFYLHKYYSSELDITVLIDRKRPLVGQLIEFLRQHGIRFAAINSTGDIVRLSKKGADIIFFPMIPMSGPRRLMAFPVPTVTVCYDMRQFDLKIPKEQAKIFYSTNNLGGYILRDFASVINSYFFKRYLLKWLRKTDFILTVSKFSKSRIENITGVKSDKIRTISGATPEIQIYTPPMDIENKQYGLPQGKYFLALSGNRPEKNLINILQAFKKLVGKYTDFMLLVAGMDDFYANKIQQYISIFDNVYFYPYVSDKFLGELYKNAYALVFPSLYEGFGLPILEAMKNNCLVISSNTTSIPEVAGEAAIYVDPHKVDSIFEGMRIAIENPEIAKAKKELGLQQWMKFRWESVAEKTLKALKKVGK
jgi:glycosyltransferase involved in cell wall biosynthesis